MRSSLLPLAGLMLGALLAGCAQSGLPSVPAARVFDAEVANRPAVLGEYDLTIDPESLTVDLTRVQQVQGIGDELLLDLGATLRPICFDCFQARRIALTPQQEIAVDFRLRHPFPDTFPRKQYDVFDVRAIVLVSLGAEAFNETPPGANGIIATNAQIITNAVGYTTHYTERIPGLFRATVHPFIPFFTEDNPDPVAIGAMIPDHRMAYGQWDEQRMLIVPPSSSPFTLRMVLEANYVVAADDRDPELPGGTANPVYFLPEGHQDEPFSVTVAIEGGPVQVGAPSNLTIRVTAMDWQAGFFTDANFPNLSNPAGLNPAKGLGGLGGVTLEVPVIFLYDDAPSTTTGLGTLASPRVWTFAVPFEVPLAGRYPLLVTVSDQRQPADLDSRTSLDDLRAFRIAFIEVAP